MLEEQKVGEEQLRLQSVEESGAQEAKISFNVGLGERKLAE